MSATATPQRRFSAGRGQAENVESLKYTLTTQNFNPAMALAAATVIPEPDATVPVEVIPSEAMRMPGVLLEQITDAALADLLVAVKTDMLTKHSK